MATDGAAGYGLDNAWRKALARLRSLEQWLDPATIRHLRARGVGAGWRCLEVGAGAGSIARWLCGQVCPGGEVVATDIDTRFLESRSEANLRVLRHDITADNLPPAAFDLVHCRLVLAHLPDRHAVLSKLAAALKPGGQLVAEEMDFVSVVADTHQPAGRAFNAAVARSDGVAADVRAATQRHGDPRARRRRDRLGDRGMPGSRLHVHVAGDNDRLGPAAARVGSPRREELWTSPS